MHKFESLIRTPLIYAFFANLRKAPNFEKILYLRHVKKGFTVFDIGANKGYFTKIFSIIVGQSGEVHSFEPVKETYTNLIGNCKGIKNNIKMNNCAVGKKKGEALISYDPKDSEKAKIEKQGSRSAKLQKVYMTSIDEYIDEENIQRLDFIKIDVEGHELEVLQGMINSLKRFSPELSIEITLPEKERSDILSLLKDLQYDSFRVIEKNYPDYIQSKYSMVDYLYLHAYSSKST